MIYLKTARLILRNLSTCDLQAIYRYRSNESCARYQRWENTSQDAISDMIRCHSGDVFLSTRETQHYAIATSDGSCIGDLSFFYNPDDNCVTLGVTVSPAYQGRGYACEMLQEVITATQRKYPAMDIVALIDPENRNSIRLFEKLGFVRECYAESIRSYVYTIFGKTK